VLCSTNGEKWTSNNSTSIHFGNIGWMHQGLCVFPSTAGAKAYYRVASPAASSAVFTITPVPARSPSDIFAVFGDFGLTNDVRSGVVPPRRCSAAAPQPGHPLTHMRAFAAPHHRPSQVCLNDIIAEAQKGSFDSVLHVGDWAYVRCRALAEGCALSPAALALPPPPRAALRAHPAGLRLGRLFCGECVHERGHALHGDQAHNAR
jgi:hypothetical protein